MYLLRFKALIISLWLIFFTLLIYISINYLYLSNNNLFYQSFAEQLAADRIEKMIELSRKWQWLGYTLIPLLTLIRIGFTTICLYTGCFFVDLKVRFSTLFKVALLADFVFVLAGITKLVILVFFKDVSTLDDLQFQPLSLLELFDKSLVEGYLIYPLSLISLFELLYWAVLSLLLIEVVSQPLGKTIKLVAFSYGTGLSIWVLFIMFLTINIT